MALTDEELKASLEILKELDDLLEQGPWDKNPFFRGVGQKLRDARERFVQELGLNVAVEETKFLTPVIDENIVEVYVSLYQAEGSNLSKWQTVVNSLAGYNLTRPVYKNEADIQKAFRAKEFKQNDAYVVVKVRKDDFAKLVMDKPAVDRHGHELVLLRERAIKLENIVRFVHVSGQYTYRNGLLIKEEN